MTEINIEGYGRFYTEVPDELVNKYKEAYNNYMETNYTDDEFRKILDDVTEEIKDYIYRHDNNIDVVDSIDIATF